MSVRDDQLNDVPGWPKYSAKGFFSSPALADLDGDGVPEILAGSEAGKLFAWHPDGGQARGFPVDLGARIWASPTVLDGPRLSIGGQEQMFLFQADGRVAEGWPQPMQGWPDATAAHVPEPSADPPEYWLTLYGMLTPNERNLIAELAWTLINNRTTNPQAK